MSDWFTVDDGGADLDVFVTFTVSPIVPATYGQPAEGGEIELLSAEPEGRCDILDSLSDASQAHIREQIAVDSERFGNSGPDPDYLRDLHMERAA